MTARDTGRHAGAVGPGVSGAQTPPPRGRSRRDASKGKPLIDDLAGPWSTPGRQSQALIMMMNANL